MRLRFLAAHVRDVMEPSDWPEDEVPHYSIPNLDNRGSAVIELRAEIGSAKLRVQRGDTLVSKLNPHKPRVHEVTHATALASTEFFVLRSPTVDARYIRYFLQSELAVQDLVSRMRSVTRSHQRATDEDVGNLRVPIVAEGRSRLIADFLDRETHRIDSLIEAKKKLIELLTNRERSMIDEAISFDEPVTVRRLARYWNSNVDKKLSEDEQPVLLCNYTDVYYGSYLESSNTFSKGTASSAEIAQNTLRQGDVVITKDSETPVDIGVPAYIATDLDAVCGYHLTVIRTDGRHLKGEYLYWALLTSNARGQLAASAQGVTRFGLTLDKIGSLAIPVVPLLEQQRIASMLRERSWKTTALKAALADQLTLLAEYRQALITAAVTGQLDEATLRGKKPTDEALRMELPA